MCYYSFIIYFLNLSRSPILNDFKLKALLSTKLSIKVLDILFYKEEENLYNNDPFDARSKVDCNRYTIFYEHNDLVFSIDIKFLLKDYFKFGFPQKILGDEEGFILNKISHHLTFLEYVIFEKSKSYTSSQEEAFIKNFSTLIYKEILNYEHFFDLSIRWSQDDIHMSISNLYFNGLEPIQIYKKLFLDILEPYRDLVVENKLFDIILKSLES